MFTRERGGRGSFKTFLPLLSSPPPFFPYLNFTGEGKRRKEVDPRRPLSFSLPLALASLCVGSGDEGGGGLPISIPCSWRMNSPIFCAFSARPIEIPCIPKKKLERSSFFNANSVSLFPDCFAPFKNRRIPLPPILVGQISPLAFYSTHLPRLLLEVQLPQPRVEGVERVERQNKVEAGSNKCLEKTRQS